MKHAGFLNTRYAYNRGHWKYFNETRNDSIATPQVYSYEAKALFKGREKNAYITDFLVRKAREFMKWKNQIGQPFALMLSIPDP